MSKVIEALRVEYYKLLKRVIDTVMQAGSGGASRPKNVIARLANASYTNMLLHGPTVTKVAAEVTSSRVSALTRRAPQEELTV